MISNNNLPINEEELTVQSVEGTDEPKGKVLHIKKGMEGYVDALTNLSQYANIGHVLSHIEKAKTYVVEVPLKYQEGLDTGKYFLNQNKKNGIMYPTLMAKTENGKSVFKENLPIIEKEFTQGNPMQDIAQGIHNLYIQQQIGAIAEKVDLICSAVERIEQGQKNDRIALLKSGYGQIQRALLQLKGQDPESIRIAIELGRKSLSDGKAQIGEMLKVCIEGFKPISEKEFDRFTTALMHDGIFNKRDKEFHEIQDLYETFLWATKFLAATYLLFNNVESANQVFEESIRMIKEINFDKIQTIKYLHNTEEVRNSFAFRPIVFFESEKRDIKELAKSYNCIQIEVTGEDLLEVANSER